MSLDFWRVTATETQISAPASGRIALNSPVALDRKTVRNLGLTTEASTGNTTLTAAMIAGGLITVAPTGAQIATFDTAANILAALPVLANDGDTFMCFMVNLAAGAFTSTLAVAAGLTIANVGQTVAQNESAILLLRRTSATTIVVYILGA